MSKELTFQEIREAALQSGEFNPSQMVEIIMTKDEKQLYKILKKHFKKLKTK